MTAWLSILKDDTKTFKKQWRWLVPLTVDLSKGKNLERKYPSFWETVLEENDPKADLTVSRRNSLKKMNSAPILKSILEVWKKQLHYVVPDPAGARKSDYAYHARWAQAVFELNKDEYSALIARWRKKHDRRRNLWRDLKAMHLPVG